LFGLSLKSVSWTFAGLALPLVVAAATVPLLIDRIGPERFGFLALAWGLVGYAGALDLGIGRAVTQRLASLQDPGKGEEALRVFRSGVRITQIAGAIGGVLLLAAASIGLHRYVGAETVAPREIFLAAALVALALPIQSISSTYRGVNEAYGNFVGIGVLRIALGIANFGGPFLVSFVTTDLAWLVSTVLFSRVGALVVYRALAVRSLPAVPATLKIGVDRATMLGLFRFGGWYTVSTVLSPVLMQADRFFIGMLISAAAVTSYVLPYEVVIQSLVIVGAVTTVLFPAISKAVSEDPGRARKIYRYWLLRVGLGMAVLTGVLASVMPWLLDLWLGSRVSEESATVGRILCLGVLLNSAGAVTFAYLHAHGWVRQTAIAHLFEVPIFLVALYWGVTNFGIIGAAAAWVLRMIIDTILLFLLVVVLHKTEAAG
jgi:O-antigen/teichoic acid export membrane protein